MTGTGGARRVLCGLLVGTVLALGGASVAGATEHDATPDGGAVDVRIDFGVEFAGQPASILVLQSESDPAAPADEDIAFVTEVMVDDAGIGTFRAALPSGLDYWLATTAQGGERYVAMLDGSEVGGGDEDGDGGDSDGGSDGGSDGDTDTDGSDDGGGPGSDGAGSAGDASDQLGVTGMPSWFLPAGLLAASALLAGGVLLARRRSVRG